MLPAGDTTRCNVANASYRPDLTVRFEVDEDAGIVFPMAAVGRHATAEKGMFEKIAADDAEAHAAAAEQAAAGTSSDFSATYHAEAAGAIIR